MAKPFGRIYGDEQTPCYLTPDGLAVWMWRKGQRVRFFIHAAMVNAQEPPSLSSAPPSPPSSSGASGPPAGGARE